MNKLSVLGLALALAGFSASAAAGEGFIRGEVGSSKLSVSGASANETSFAARGGYMFNSNFGVEGFASQYGSDDGATATGLGIGLVARTTSKDGFYFGGRAGIARNKLDVDGFGSVSQNKPYFGVGAGYDFKPNMSADLRIDRTKISSATITTTALGLEFRF